MMKKIFLAIIVFISIINKINSESENMITFYTSQKYLSYINKGYNAFDTMNYPLALTNFLLAKDKNPNLFASYDALGDLFETVKKYDLSIYNYDKALKLVNPKYCNDIVDKIKYYVNNNQKKLAISLYKIVLNIRPEAGLQFLYGERSFNKKDYKEAIKYYNRAIKLQEDPNEYLKYLEVKYTNKEYEKYIIRKYIKNNLKYPEAYYKKGLAYFKLNNYEEAIESFNKAIERITVPVIQYKYYIAIADAYYLKAIKNKVPSQDLLRKALEYYKIVSKYEDSLNNKLSIAKTYYYIDLSKMLSYDNELYQAEKDFEKVSNLPENDPEYIDKKNNYEATLKKKYNLDLFNDSLYIVKNINEDNSELYLTLANIYSKKAQIYQFGVYNRYKYMGAEKSSARTKSYNYYMKSLEYYRKYIRTNTNNKEYIYYEVGLIYYYMSKLEPDINNLPITNETKGDYQRYGVKFYKRDMLNRSIANFNLFLKYYPNGTNSSKVRTLVNEMRLALIYI